MRSRLGRKLRLSSTPGDAEDLIQEAFLRLLQAEARGSAFPRDPAAYLWRVADRVAYDQARNLRTQKRGGGIFPAQLTGDEEVADSRRGRKRSRCWRSISSRLAGLPAHLCSPVKTRF
jgi:DNA-directed RNA polymerase specialized sigma24 family protein